jgi:light-regulated signal transduction histidine kinase (bacteriophytochrome)
MVSSYTQLLAERYAGQLDEKADQYIEYAVEGATRMRTLISDLLQYSRLHTRGREPEMIGAQDALDLAVANLERVIGEQGAVITNDELPQVLADQSQLVQLFQNLLSNAIKFRRVEAPRVHISAEPSDGRWQFSVRDNGIGIESRYQTKVFDVFERLHTQAEYPGTGIGLALCRRIVERHGGRIWFDSKPGQGTTFHFTLTSEGERRNDAS